MIDKLYNLKQQQINQQLQQRQLVLSKIADIDKELIDTDHRIHSVTIDVMGAISDFRILQIHKETMKEHIVKLSKEKEHLKKQLEHYDNNIVHLNKESEQFNYILQEQKKQKAKELIKIEENAAAEYMQAKYIKERKEHKNV